MTEAPGDDGLTARKRAVFSCSLLVDWLLRMRDGQPYGVHGGHRLRRSIREKEADGRPQVFLS